MTPFRVRLSDPARQDIVDVLQYTLEYFGERQHSSYRGLIEDALVAIGEEPRQAPSKQRDELSKETWVRPIRKPGRHARHMFVFRFAEDGWIEVGRLLHEAVDIERHLADEYLR